MWCSRVVCFQVCVLCRLLCLLQFSHCFELVLWIAVSSLSPQLLSEGQWSFWVLVTSLAISWPVINLLSPFARPVSQLQCSVYCPPSWCLMWCPALWVIDLYPLDRSGHKQKRYPISAHSCTSIADTDASAIQSTLANALHRQLVHADGAVGRLGLKKTALLRTTNRLWYPFQALQALSVLVSSRRLSVYRHPTPLIGHMGNAPSNSTSSIAASPSVGRCLKIFTCVRIVEYRKITSRRKIMIVMWAHRWISSSFYV